MIAAASGDDSELFMGILARYLAEAALSLGDTTAPNTAHFHAGGLKNHAEVDGLPLFGADWTRPVTVPPHPGPLPQLTRSPAASLANLGRDLSVRLSEWMPLEADDQLTTAERTARSDN